MRFAKAIEAIAPIFSKFEELKDKGKDYEPSVYELGSLFQEYNKALKRINKERDSCIHLLKDKYQSERRNVLRCQTSGLEQLYKECSTMFSNLKGYPKVQLHLKDKGQLLRYCKLSDQFNEARVKLQEEIVKTNALIEQGARSTKIKSALPKVREMKDVMDDALNEQRTLIRLDSTNRDFFSVKEVILAEVERELQEATIKWIEYVDPDQRKGDSQPDGLEDDKTLTQDSENPTTATVSKESFDGAQKLTATEKLDQSLKLLRSTNDTISLDYSGKNDYTFGQIESSED